MRFPIETVNVTDEIFQALSKIHEGIDPSFDYHFKDQNTKDEFLEYLKSIKHLDKFKESSLNCARGPVNAIAIIDTKMEQTTDKPMPYWWILDMQRVIDYGYNQTTSQIEFVYFDIDNEREGFYCDGYYRILKKDQQHTIIHEGAHGLGYCPATFVIHDYLTMHEPDVKASPMSSFLGEFDHLLFFLNSKKYLELFAPYPIYWGYVPECHFVNKEGTEYCDTGFLRLKDGPFLFEGRELVECPACSNKIAGVGSYIDVIPPKNPGEPLLSPPVGVVPVDINSLEYNSRESDRRAKRIYDAITGSSFEVMNSQAMNEMQISAMFEARLQVILKFKRNFEISQEFIESTCARLMYGDLFVSCSINYGTQFYLYTADQLLEVYTKSAFAGLDITILDQLQNMYFEAKYKSNKNELQRVRIIAALDNLRHYTVNGAKLLHDVGLVDTEDLQIKIYLSTFVSRFEIENGDLVSFGANIDYTKKLKTIRETFLSYLKEKNYKDVTVESISLPK